MSNNDNNIYQAIFENAPIGMARISLNGKVIEANNAFAAILNYSKNELVSKALSDIIDPVDYIDYMAAQKRILSKSDMSNTLIHHKFKKDGTPVMISCNLSLIKDQEGLPLYFIHVIKDFSQQEYESNKLKTVYEEKRFINYMLDHTNNLIFVADKDSKFVYINETVIEQYGYSKDELMNMSIGDIDINYNPFNREEFWEIFSKEKVLQINTIHADKNGTLHPVFIHAHYIEYKGEVYNFGVVEDQSRLQALFDLQDGFIILTDGEALQMTNRHLLEFFNYSDFTAFKHEHECICDFFIKEEGFVFNHPSWIKEVRDTIHNDAKVKMLRPNSNEYHVFLVRAVKYDESRFVVTFIDISELENYKEKLKLLATTDELTGLYNRRTFNKILPQEINRARRDGKLIVMMIIDVDFFKQYNDTYGHIAGDHALTKIGHTIKNYLLRASDFGFRLGGEEFGVICTVSSPEEAMRIADNLRKTIEELGLPHEKNTASMFISVSIGVAVHKSTSTPEELYFTADTELYKAKDSGRNRISIV